MSSGISIHTLSMQANQFAFASDILINNEHLTTNLISPIVANLSLACELFLKTMCKAQGVGFRRTHDLHSIFETLSTETQHIIHFDFLTLVSNRKLDVHRISNENDVDYILSLYNIDFDKFKCILYDMKDYFMHSRYPVIEEVIGFRINYLIILKNVLKKLSNDRYNDWYIVNK